MKIKWQVDDGYVGKDRPQFTEIDDNELAECTTEQERESLIIEAIDMDFIHKISWYRT